METKKGYSSKWPSRVLLALVAVLALIKLVDLLLDFMG